MNPLVIIGAIQAGIKVYQQVRPLIKSIKNARRSTPRSSSMVLSPDGNPMYHHTLMPSSGETYQTMEFNTVNNGIIQ